MRYGSYYPTMLPKLDAHYFRPTEDQVLAEYMKAEPFLTIDPNVRLTNENKTLRIEVSKVDGVLDYASQSG